MSKPVLLVVDVQESLVKDGPWRGKELLSTIRGLEESFREHGAEVAFVRHDDGPESEDMAFGSLGWEITAEVAPLPGERIFDKRRNSAFLGTGLEEYLRDKGVDTLVIVGMQTEYCIDATIKSALERGYRILVPTDGVTTFDNGMLTAAELNRLFFYQIWKGRFAEILLPGEIESEVLS